MQNAELLTANYKNLNEKSIHRVALCKSFIVFTSVNVFHESSLVFLFLLFTPFSSVT